MAAIDYSIPGQFKGLQIEPPMNAMARAMELRNLQDTMQVNQLSRQQAQEMTRQRNALAQLHTTPGMDIGSENYLTRVSQVAPLLLPDVASQQLKRLELKEKTQSLDLKQKEQEAKNIDLALGEFNRVFNPTLISSADEAEARTRAIYKHPVLGPRAKSLMPEDQAIARSRQEFERNPQGYAAAQLGLSGKDIIEANDRRVKELRERAEKSYPAYQLAELEAGREPLLIDQYVAQRTGGATAAPVLAPTTATASTPAPEMVGGTGEMVTLPDGTKQTPETVKTDKKPPSAFGADIHPLVPTLIAGGNKDMATIVQEGHKASGALRQINDTFKEIERLETEKPKGYEARIKALRDYIKVVSTEGPGTRVQVGVKLSEQEKGFEGDLGKGQAKRVLEDKDKAEDARDMLSTVNIGRDILKSGAITGAGADFFVGFNQALKTAGIDAGYADASANSQAYSATMAQNVGKLIKLFGAGTGLSDADRAYAEKMAGGKIALDRKALEKILDITERASRNVIKRYNKNVKGIKTNIPLEVELEDEVAPTPASPRKAPAPYSDAEKERRYQEWKAKQKGNKP